MFDKRDFPCGCFDPVSRRRFLTEISLGMGSAALAGLLGPVHAQSAGSAAPVPVFLGRPHFAPRAKRIIYLFQSGGPSHLDLFDHKPLLQRMNGEELPESVRGMQRLTGMTSQQGVLPLAGSAFEFRQYGQSGAWVSELMPYTAEIVDELCLVKSMYTEAINHDPAITFFQTGSQQPGLPSIGWGARTRTCRPSACCSRAAATATSRSTRGCGAPASCPRCTRGCSSGRGATRCCTWAIRRASPAKGGARCSITSPT